MGFFSTQGQVTLTWCGWKLNSSEILWLSWLPARLMKIGSKVKSLSSAGQHCLHYKSMGKKYHRSRASNSKENSPIWPEIKLIRDFIAVLVTCKFEEYPIIDRTRSTMGFFDSQGQVTLKWRVWACRNSNSSASLMMIESKLKALRTDKIKYGYLCHSKASNSEVDSPIWPKFELIQDFMAVLVTCKTDEDPIKGEVAIIQTTFSPL